MTRHYNLKNPPPAEYRAERARAAGRAAHSPDSLISRLEKANLTPAHIERLRALRPSAPAEGADGS